MTLSLLRRSGAIAIAAGAAIAFASPSARAQAQGALSPPANAPSAKDAATAKKNFESGLKLYGEQAYAEALIAFESSYKLGGRPSALKNVAQCERNLKHFAEAYEDYAALLARHEAQLSPADKQAVRQAMDELSLLTVPLVVTTSEPGAAIELDGKPIGTSPLAGPKRISITEHRVRVTKPGFEPAERALEPRAGRDEHIEVKLEPERTGGRVAIREQTGRDVHVFVDGVDQGTAPWQGDLSQGEHAVELKGPRFASERRTVTVARRGNLELALDAAPITGHVRVVTVPLSATIVVDGKPVGTGSWDGDVAPGPHRIEASLTDASPAVREVIVQRGETVVQEIPLLSAVSGERPPDFRGVYARLSVHPLFPLGSAPVNEVPGQSDGQVGVHLGLGGNVRVGYAFDWLGVEAVGVFMFEHRDERLDASAPSASSGTGTSGPTSIRYSSKFESNGANFFFGAGARATSKDSSVRFTFGLAPGLSFRSFPVHRGVENGDGSGGNGGTNCLTATNCATSNSNEQSFPAAGYTTFGFLADGGVLFGSTPGAKFYLGVNAWLDFPPADVVVGPSAASVPLARPGRGYAVVDSVQFFVGPTLGIQLGH
jgi:hypothetical protein